jgi:hypothetical protein
MKRGRTMGLVSRIYDEVHLALWAILVGGLSYFAVFVAPKVLEFQAAAERLRLQNIANENEIYCAKWRMGAGTSAHDGCIEDLQELRAHIERQNQLDAAF